MIILRHGKFISGSRILKSGDVLPDTEEARKLVEVGRAEIINSSKPAKKRQPDKTENSPENVEGNT